eukprot:7201000-Alexandrium_andersonii.AAC.1
MRTRVEAEGLQALHLAHSLTSVFALALVDEVWQGAAAWKARSDQGVKGERHVVATRTRAGQAALRQ